LPGCNEGGGTKETVHVVVGGWKAKKNNSSKRRMKERISTGGNQQECRPGKKENKIKTTRMDGNAQDWQRPLQGTAWYCLTYDSVGKGGGGKKSFFNSKK